MLDVPRELVREVASLLRAVRRARGTHKDSRVLTCWYQALIVLAWFRNHGDIALVGAGFGVSRATAYPRRIGDYAKAALVLIHIEQLQLRTSR